MNLTYGDTSLSVRYLEAFLQSEYDSTLRVSGIYDTYTHNNLIAYASLPEVLGSNEMYDILTETYDELKLFNMSRTVNKIIYQSKATTENPEIEEAMIKLQATLFEFVKHYGWSVTKFISSSKSKDLYKIELTQDTRKNLIPSDALSLINLSTENFIFNSVIVDNVIKADESSDIYMLLTSEPEDWSTRYNTYYVYNGVTQEYELNATDVWESGTFFELLPKSCCMVIPCEPDTDYIICHRINNPDPMTNDQLQVRISVASSEYITPNTQDNSSLLNNTTYKLKQGECSEPFRTSSAAQTLIVSYQYDQLTYNKSILVIKKPNTWENSFIPDSSEPEKMVSTFIDTKTFVKSFWLVNSKYLDYLFKSVITEFSSEEDILYVQNLLQSVCKNYQIILPGKYTSDLKDMIFKYQMLNLNDDIHYPISYALGYLDAETEARLIKDSDRGLFVTL